jgi:hypothetical protein
MSKKNDLSNEEVAILRRLEDDEYRVIRTRLDDTPERRRMKKLGLIMSSPLNPNGMRSVSGKGAWWRLTDAGRAALAEIERLDRAEKGGA